MPIYKRGDLVWAKMKGFPKWPGIITAPPPELKKQPMKKSTLYHCIYFFGTQNYSWIETQRLERYTKGAPVIGKRSSTLREAINAIDAFIDTGEGGENFNITPEDDVFDKLVKETKIAEQAAASSTTPSSSTSTPSSSAPTTPFSAAATPSSTANTPSSTTCTPISSTNTPNVPSALSTTSTRPGGIISGVEGRVINLADDSSIDMDSDKEESGGCRVIDTESEFAESGSEVDEDIVQNILDRDKPTPNSTSNNKSPYTKKKDLSKESTAANSTTSSKEKEARSSKSRHDKKTVNRTPDVVLIEEDPLKLPEPTITIDLVNDSETTSELLSSTSVTPVIIETTTITTPTTPSPVPSSTTSSSTPTSTATTSSTPVSSGSNKSPGTLGSKKKKVQQIVKARPFRQLPKPRVLLERARPPTTSTTEKDASSSPSTSVESSSSRKRSSQSSSPASGSSTSTATDSSSKKKKSSNVCHPQSHHSFARRGPAAHLFDRPPIITRPDTPPLDLFSISQTLLDKHITPSVLRFGFLGLGIMGSGMVKNLLNSGHRVIVWNRSPERSREFAKVGAEMAVTPQDVCFAADITFSCVSDPKAAKDMVFGNCGALREMNSTKGYVEMTNIDKETSLDINEAITARGARYLEAQIQGSKAEADEGTLVILTAGDRSLYNECHSCFEAFGRSSFYLGEVGNACKMNVIIQMIAGIQVAGIAEGLALADRCGLTQADLLEVVGMTRIRSPLISEKGKLMTDMSFPTSLALQHMQKDLTYGLRLAEELEQPLPITAAANEVYKHAKRIGYGEHDVAAVYIRSRY